LQIYLGNALWKSRRGISEAVILYLNVLALIDLPLLLILVIIIVIVIVIVVVFFDYGFRCTCMGTNIPIHGNINPTYI